MKEERERVKWLGKKMKGHALLCSSVLGAVRRTEEEEGGMGLSRAWHVIISVEWLS